MKTAITRKVITAIAACAVAAGVFHVLVEFNRMNNEIFAAIEASPMQRPATCDPQDKEVLQGPYGEAEVVCRKVRVR